MRKIPTLFKRDESRRYVVIGDVTPGCEWVLAGEGVPTRKWDGTCMMIDDDHKMWARRAVKRGKQAPAGFVAVDHDDVTGETTGWEPVEQSPFAAIAAEARKGDEQPGTYELCGPKINGNPEGLTSHRLIRHGADIIPGVIHANPLALCAQVLNLGFEGIVFRHSDGRMAKLKARDIDPNDLDVNTARGILQRVAS